MVNFSLDILLFFRQLAGFQSQGYDVGKPNYAAPRMPNPGVASQPAPNMYQSQQPQGIRNAAVSRRNFKPELQIRVDFEDNWKIFSSPEPKVPEKFIGSAVVHQLRAFDPQNFGPKFGLVAKSKKCVFFPILDEEKNSQSNQVCLVKKTFGK